MGFMLALALVIGSHAGGLVPSDTDSGWDVYRGGRLLDADNAGKVKAAFDSPEGAVMAFYAGRMRADEAAWQAALPPADKRGDSLRRKLAEMKDWTFVRVLLVAKKAVDPGSAATHVYVRLYMDVDIKGERDGGFDEAECEFVDGRWFVTRPPT